MAEVRRLKFLEGITVVNPIDVAVVIGQSGEVALSLGDSSKTVTFVTPMQNVNYNPIVNFICNDSDPIFLNYVIQNKTVNGFDVKLNAAVDSNNYKLTYIIGA